MVLPNSINGGTICTTFPGTGDRYVVVIDHSNEAKALRLAPNGTTWTSVDLSTVASNALALPVDDDEHNYLSCIVDQANRLIISGNMHHQPMRIIRSNVAGSVTGGFTDISSAFETFADDVYTYPSFSVTSTGTIFFHLRRRDNSPPADYARNVLYRSTTAGSWEDLGDFVRGTSGSVWHGYMCPINIDPVDDVLRVAGSWALDEVGLPAENRRDPFYMESHDLGETWKNVKGDALTTPLTKALATSQGAYIGFSPSGNYSPPLGACLSHLNTACFTIRELFGYPRRLTWNPATLTWGMSSPTVQTGIIGPHIPFHYDSELWYTTAEPRATWTRRDGLVKAHIASRPGPSFAPPGIDVNAYMDGIIQVVAFEADGLTPSFRTFGNGLKLTVP